MTRVPKTISSKSIYKNKFVEIKVDEVSLDGNNWEHAYYIKPHKNAAGVIPIDETGMYLVQQFRYPSQGYFWQIPMGMMEDEAEPIETARRELLEETGISAQKLSPIGSLYGEPGMSSQEVFIYVGEHLSFGEKHTDINEIGMHLKHFTFAEIDEGIKNGMIKCGFTLSAILLFKNNFHLQ